MSYEFLSTHSHDWSLDPLVETACRHWETRRQAVAKMDDLPRRNTHAFSIALSREAGTLGTTVAREVAKRLEWHVYDHELLERIADEMGVRAKLLESVDERQQSWLTEAIEAFLSSPNQSEWEPYISESAFVRHLVETVLALGVHGECVIVGRGASFILPRETTLRVRLVAPVKARIETLSRKFNLSKKDAALRIRSLDRDRVDFVQDHFHHDPMDPLQYDIVLNVARMSTDTAAGLVVDALHHLQNFSANDTMQPTHIS